MFDVSRQHPLRRVLIALWACWFVLLITEPAMLHSCPMHDGGGTSHAMTASDAPLSAHDGHNMPHANTESVADGVAETSHAPAPGNAAPHACTCIGHCSASVTVAPSYASAMSWLEGIIDLAPVLPMVRQTIPVTPDFVLPFANGPPRLSSSRNA